MTLTLILASALLVACVLDGLFGFFAGGRSVPAHRDGESRGDRPTPIRSRPGPRQASKGDPR